MTGFAARSTSTCSPRNNLPYYTHTLLSHAPKGHPILDWNHQWTRKRTATPWSLRDWVHVSRCIDPTLLEDGRRVQMKKGEVPQPGDMARTDCLRLVPGARHPDRAPQYRSETAQGRQDWSQRARSHRRDETKHYLFYRDLTLAAFAIDPSTMMIAVAKQVREFAMPGTGIPSFHSTRGAHRARGHLRTEAVLARRA